MKKEEFAALLLLILGLLQMAAVLANISPIQGLAAATVASPAPKVFSVSGGLETYSTKFHLEWKTQAGKSMSLEITPELYTYLKGPYMRRNVYGAILAFGPVLYSDERSRPLFDSAAEYALCGDAPVLRELGIDPKEVAGNVRVRFIPREGMDIDPLPDLIEVPCP